MYIVDVDVDVESENKREYFFNDHRSSGCQTFYNITSKYSVKFSHKQNGNHKNLI